MTNAIEPHVIGDTAAEEYQSFPVVLSNAVDAAIDSPSAIVVIANYDKAQARRRPANR